MPKVYKALSKANEKSNINEIVLEETDQISVVKQTTLAKIQQDIDAIDATIASLSNERTALVAQKALMTTEAQKVPLKP